MNCNPNTGKRHEIKGRLSGTRGKLTNRKLSVKPRRALLGGLAVAAAIAAMTQVAGVAPASAIKNGLVSTTEQPLLDQAIGGRCVPAAARDILRSYRLKIATAPTVEEARDLILLQTRLAAKALSTASWILPFSPSVREARDKIESLERRVYAANTQAEVARDFSEVLALPAEPDSPDMVGGSGGSSIILAGADLNESAVRVGTEGGGGCNYTTGEIIIIILGFLLFIIPGIIFLIIFC
jgi:hypothetical protein